MRLASVFGLLVLLAGCSLAASPSQQHPVCSWTSKVPAAADRTCRVVFHTLTIMVAAQAHGDDATLQRIAAANVASMLIAEGRGFRAQKARGLHVVPSVTLEVERSGVIGAGFFVLGKGPKTLINVQETMQLRLHRDGARIIKAQPAQTGDQQVV